jgi:catechol 2,3-dioxygenase-like lactoylglutathione lyase family enzyme
MQTEPSAPAKPLDHVVLPVPDLKTARSRLTKLGFTVAPDGRHPFGTANCCVYFADGTFLEPLAVANERAELNAGTDGNAFAARDVAYRYRRGENGFSAVVFGTEDAAADHAAFVEAGFSAGAMLEFSRPFVDAAGRSDKASFRLAFAADLRAPDCLFFTCQRVGVPKVDRAALERHENGTVRAVSSTGDRDLESFGDNGFVLKTANARIEMMGNQELHRRFGELSSGDRGLQARAVVFGVADLKATKSYLLSKGVDCEKYRGRVIVLPAPGQGAIFAFEAS